MIFSIAVIISDNRKLVKKPKFEEAILNKIGSRIDTEEIEKEIEGLEKQHKQLTGAKARLGQQMDSLDIMDKFYEKKYQNMETRLYRFRCILETRRHRNFVGIKKVPLRR